MESNNFEKEIQQKLEQRSLEPSVSSWERLESKLDSKKKTQFRNKVWRIAIAASFVGIAFSTYLFVNNDVNTIHPNVSDTTKEVIETSDKIIKDEPKLEKQELKDVLVGVPGKTKEPKAKMKSRASESHLRPTNTQVKREAVTSTLKEDVIEIPQEKIIKQEVLVDAGIALTKPEESKGSSNQKDDEVNLLLEQAQNELVSQYNIPEVTISETDLLLDVENELEDSFRDRAFKKIKSSYNSIRTAYIERNE